MFQCYMLCVHVPSHVYDTVDVQLEELENAMKRFKELAEPVRAAEKKLAAAAAATKGKAKSKAKAKAEAKAQA